MIPGLAAFAPRRVLDHDLLADGAVLSQEATTLFLDLEGFTELTGRLGGFGSRGTEQLSGLLRAFFGTVTDEVTERGGDPIAFGGDALTFVFDGPPVAALDAARSSGEAIHRVAREVSGASTLAGAVALRTRVGIARGTVTSAVARSPERMVPVHVGLGLDLAEAAQATARAGEVVVHRSATDRAAVGSAPRGRSTSRPSDDVHRLVSPWVVDRLDSDPESHRRVSSAFVRLPPVGPLGEFVDRVGFLLDVVDEWEGEVVQVSGGDKGVVAMIVFGAPLAHADDASRATEAVLRLRERDPEIAAGVATGPVFTALLGSRTRVFATHVGLAVTTAARLMQSAAPGRLLVDAPTWAAVSRNLRSPDGPRSLALKGHGQPVEAHAVEGWRRASPTPRATSYPPLVGRESELAAIELFLERIADGHGGALTVVGDPGIGKTRLLQEAAERATTRGVTVVTTDVDVHPRGRSQPVWRELLGALLQLPPDADGDDWLAALATVLPDLADDAGLLGRLFGPLIGPVLEDEAGDPAARPDVELDAELATGALAQLLTAGPARAPVLVVVDHAHGLDDFSASILDGLGHLLTGSRTGLLVTRDLVAGGGPDTVVRVPELAAEDAARVAADAWRQAGGGSSPSWLAEVVAARAGANPLFVRSVTEALWASWEVGSPPPALDAAEDAGHALSGLLQERIDRLPGLDRQVLDVLAVLGRPCASDLVASVLGDRADPTAVAAAAARLAQHALVDVTAGDDGERHGLPHRFLRDVVRDSLSHAARDRTRRAVVEVLAASEADPVEIAEHVRRLDDDDLKRRWLPPAAASARRSWNLPQAAEYLDALRPLISGADRDRLEVERLEVLLVAGHVNDVLAEASTPFETSDPSVRARRLYALAEAAFACGEFARSAVAARELMSMSDGHDEVRYQRAAELLVVATCESGDPQAGVEVGRALVARALDSGDIRAASTARAALGAALLISGRAEEAAGHYRAALDGARTTGEIVQQVHLLSDLAGCAYEGGDHRDCLRLLGEARHLADRVGYRRHLAVNLTNDAQLRAGVGDPFAIVCAEAAVHRCVDIGDLPMAANALHTWVSVEHVDDVEPWRRLAAIDGALGRVLARAEDLANMALAAARAGQPDAASAAAASAERAAAGRPHVMRRAQFARALAGAREGVATELKKLALEAGAAEDASPVEPADVALEHWRLTDTPEARATALELVVRAWAAEPSARVHAWFAELGAPPPTSPDPLPPPVGIGISGTGDLRLESALTRVEDALRSRQRSE